MIPRFPARLAAVFLAAILLPIRSTAQQPAAAQQEVRGTVSEGGTLAPIEGAMVLLLDAGGKRVGGVLSGVNGRFRVLVPAPGRYRLRVDRIGYGSTDTDPFDVAAGASVEQKVVSAVKPIELAGIDVKGASQCRIRPGEGIATNTVWEEARKALDAASWTADRGFYSFTWARFTRQLDKDERITSEKRTQSRGVTSQPFTANDPDLLRETGYVERLPDGSWQYWAPDAKVLLSDSFLDTHCFSLEREVRDGAQMLGLSFEPRNGRGKPDVGGVLWIDQSTAELRDLEYHYTNLPQMLEYQNSGGDLTFTGLPNGTWIVKEWSITMPLIAEVRGGLPRPGGSNQLGATGGPTSRFEVNGFVSEGGIVQRAIASSGEVVLDDLSGGIRGVLVNAAGDPVPGVKVRVSGTAFEDQTDSLGVFAFAGVGAGTWKVVPIPFELEVAGLEGAGPQVKVGSKGMSTVRLAVPSLAESLTAACEATPPGSGFGVVAGRVLDDNGAPVPGATVELSWNSTTTSVGTAGAGASNTLGGAAGGLQNSVQTLSGSTVTSGATATTDTRGAFRFCGVPYNEAVAAQATMDGKNSDETRVAMKVADGGGVALLFVRLGADR